MTSPFSSNLSPQIKGYRIVRRVHNEDEQKNSKQTMIKIVIKNQANGIPRIRNDVVCNGKHFGFIPLLSFTTEDDLKMVQQISTIVLRDQNQILCQILTNNITQVKSSQFAGLQQRMKNIFGLELRIDPEQLFLILISDQISTDQQFNQIFDSISETEFVHVIKRVYQNCPNRIIPKILRKINKYFNSTKIRTQTTIQRIKRFLKLVKLTYDSNQAEQVQQEIIVKKIQAEQESQEQKRDKVQIKQLTKKQQLSNQSVPKLQEKPKKKSSIKEEPQKSVHQVSIPKNTQTLVQKISQTQKVTKTQKVKKTQNFKKVQKQVKQPEKQVKQPEKQVKQLEKQVKQQAQTQPTEQKQQQWNDVDDSEDEEEIKDSNKKFNFHADDSDQDLKYQGPKKKNYKKQNNIVIPLDPELQKNKGKKQQPLQKQNKYKSKNNNYSSNFDSGNKNNGRNANNNGFRNKNPDQNEGPKQDFDRRNNNRQDRPYNGSSNNNGQSMQRGRRQFSKDNKKVDGRILLGLNGANDSVWRQRMRPPKYPKDQNEGSNNNRYRNNRQNKDLKGKLQNSNNDSLIVTKINQKDTSKQVSSQKVSSSNLKLERVFTFPEDSQKGKQFKFQNKNYNMCVNKLFWVNIAENQITIQKDGKGYRRKCAIQIVDNGKGIIGEGLTLNIQKDGLSNLEDGGTPFGDPVFQQFTPNGQWFHISSLEVFAYQ